jgi:hypothetical protein
MGAIEDIAYLRARNIAEVKVIFMKLSVIIEQVTKKYILVI